MIYVIKRDGRQEAFDFKKIENALKKASDATGYPYKSEVLIYLQAYFDSIEKASEEDVKLDIEAIQDKIEMTLMKFGCFSLAKDYILYRRVRAIERTKKANNLMKQKLSASLITGQNANVDEKSFGGRIGEASRVWLKEYALNNCMSKMARENHEKNIIYIHDLDSYAVGMHNCLSIPFDDILAKGFHTKQADVRPASSLNTAFQLIAVVFQIQSLQQFGGVSSTHLDWTMVPYFRLSFYKHYMEVRNILPFCSTKNTLTKAIIRETSVTDKYYLKGETFLGTLIKKYIYKKAWELTVKELNQAVEGMFHNLNTLQSRSGNQLPFTSINYGTCTLPEGREVIKAILNGSLKGVGKFHKTPIFPCNIFQYMKGVNDKPGTPNYDMYQLALKSTSHRLYPNYANVDWSGNKGYDKNDPTTYFSTMGCRTANGFDINGFGQKKDGRGNICPVTIILPTVAKMTIDQMGKAYAISDLLEVFFVNLEQTIEDAKDMLLERFEWICNQSPECASFMYENNTMAGYVPEEGIKSALKHGTLAIGQLGLAEALQLLVFQNQTGPEGMKLAEGIESLFRDKCAEFKTKYSLNFGVYYTPAENLCYTAMKKFKEAYGEIPNVSDRDFFTNSIHVPVWEELTPMQKIDIESKLTGYSSAGCITYVELPSTVHHNLSALEDIVNYAMDNDIPYFGINIPIDTCSDCGASGEFGDTCPECGSSHIERLRRVTGYLSGDYQKYFNKGKIAETDARVKHSI